MKLYIRFGSLAKFKSIFDSNEFLQVALTKIRANIYEFKKEEETEIKKILSNVKFDVK